MELLTNTNTFIARVLSSSMRQLLIHGACSSLTQPYVHNAIAVCQVEDAVEMDKDGWLCGSRLSVDRNRSFARAIRASTKTWLSETVVSVSYVCVELSFFFFKQKTAYEI